MKRNIKGIVITAVILFIVIFAFIFYFFIWGGKTQIENFDYISHDYEIIANLSLEYYNELSSKNKHITLFIHDDHIKDHTNNTTINLNDAQKDAIKSIKEKFASCYLWVTDESVIFWMDETKYYGLIYSEAPLSTVWDMKKDWYEAMEYHRINSRWYEIGVFGV